jgi:ClpX C4-type zinc finger
MKGPDKNNDLISVLEPLWGHALQAKKFHDALIIGLLGYVFFHEHKDKSLETVALMQIMRACESILSKRQEARKKNTKKGNTCSFCGRSEPEVHLAAGISGFICDSCVEMLHGVFKKH